MVSYGETAGLSNLNVTDMLQSRSGTIWVGTENGVFLVNGASFEKQYAFQHEGIAQVRTLREDAVGRIWALDQNSLAYWEAGVVHNIPAVQPGDVTQDADLMALDGEPNAVFLLAHGRILRVFTEDGGHSWQTAAALPSMFLNSHAQLARLTSVAPAGGRQFWAGCGSALCLVDLERFTVKVRPAAPPLTNQIWTFLHRTKDGSVWAQSDSAIGVLHPGSASLEKVETPASARLDTKRHDMFEDEQGRVLLNLTRGLARQRGDGWEVLNDSNGLPRQEIDALAFTREHDVWMGTAGHGITVWKGYDQWESWTEAQGMSNSVIWPMANDHHGGLWVANDSTIDRIDLQSRRVESMPGRMPAHRMLALIADRRSHVWAASMDGQLFDIDSRSYAVRLAARGLGKVYELLEDSEGTIWVCARTGLYAITDADGWKTPVLVGPEQLPAGYAWYIAQGRHGTLWLSTEHGLYRHAQDGRWTPIHMAPGSKVRQRYLMAEAPDGTLWLQNTDPYPLLHLRVSGDVAEAIGKEPSASLGSDDLTFLNTDSRGWLWVGSDAGVAVFDGHRWVLSSMEDGLIWDDTDFHAFYEDADGSVWIGTSGGVAHLMHPERLFNTRVPDVRFESASVASKPLSMLASDGAKVNTFDLQSVSLDVRLLNTSYERGSGIQYRYHLDGVNEGWQTTDAVIRYPSLGPGRYRLTVVAYDKRRHVASSPVALSFRLLAPWWRRPWCLALEGFAAVLLLTYGWRLRVRMLLRRQQMLEGLVQERTSQLLKEKADLSAARAHLLAMSRRDSLTNLLSRAAIFEEMRRLCENTIRTGKPFAYAMADLDGFKGINDQYGHIAGDTVLRACAGRIRSVLQSDDLIGRYGGEEMLILLPDLDPSKVRRQVEHLREAIAAEPVVHNGTNIPVTCSFGIAWFSSEGFTLEKLIHKADEALYRAKRNGRNRVELADALDQVVLEEAVLA